MTAQISFRGVGKTFQVGARRRTEFTAVEGVDLDVARGEFVVLVGPSGCGKSTLLDLLGGLSTPSSGQILLDGRPVTGPGLDRGIVFQQYALLPWRTAQGNVEFGLEATGVPRRERAGRARHYLDLVGLTGFEQRHPHELSGGMKQRVAIARSLAYDPEVLLMDEPFAALDAQTRESLQDELLRIWERTGKTIVFITHGIEESVYLGQRVAVLTSRPGRVKRVVPIALESRTAVPRIPHQRVTVQLRRPADVRGNRDHLGNRAGVQPVPRLAGTPVHLVAGHRLSTALQKGQP